MKSKKHTVESAMTSLIKKNDVKFTNEGEILILKGDKAKNDLGIKSWGKIDYLINKVGFRKVLVSKF